MITTSQNKALLILCLMVIAGWAMWVGDKANVALITGAFIALLNPGD